MLPILKAIREQIGKGPGDTIAVVVWKDEEPKILEVPAHSEKLPRDEGLLPFFAKLSHTHRKECCRWISEAKQEEPGSAAWVRRSKCSKMRSRRQAEAIWSEFRI